MSTKTEKNKQLTNIKNKLLKDLRGLSEDPRDVLYSVSLIFKSFVVGTHIALHSGGLPLHQNMKVLSSMLTTLKNEIEKEVLDKCEKE